MKTIIPTSLLIRSLSRLFSTVALAAVSALLTATTAYAQAQFAGTYIGRVTTRVTVPVVGTIESDAGAYIATVSTAGVISLSGSITGTVSATGAVTFTGGPSLATLGIRTATIANNQLGSGYGDVLGNGTTQFKLNPSTGFTAAAGGGGSTGGGSTGGGGTAASNTSFTNGSFEGGPNPGAGWVTLSSGASSISGWSVVSGSIDYIGSAWQSSEGARSIDLNGVAAGGIAQTFNTVAGQSYAVTFDYAGNAGYGAGTGTKNLRVSVNNTAATSQQFTFDTTGRTLANMGWVNRSLTFTASAATTTLTFLSLSTGVYGPAIDNVKVNGAAGATSTTAGVSGITAASAPSTLVAYRNKTGQVFEFTVTGANSGAVWGTDVYTDDSHIATAAVHAGVLAVGETKAVTLTILPGQATYNASTRNGVKASAWGAWAGSFSFAGAGAVASSAAAANVATARPTAAPGFVAATTALSAGGRLVCPVSVSGGGTYTYRWYLNGTLIPGATANPYIVESLTGANAGTYSVDVSNALSGSTPTRITAGTVIVNASGAPSITLHPLSKTVAPGTLFTLVASAQGAGNTYQWFRNNVALAGETQNALLRQNINAADAGAYTVRITNTAGVVTSNPALITLSPNASRAANISCRTNIGAGKIVTPGFVVQGAGSKRVLIRAIGPGLAAFGLDGTMANPKFTVVRQSTGAIVATNDDWDQSLAPTFAAVGAFALPANSRDAALVVSLPAGASEGYTVQVSGAGNDSGITLIEVYDVDPAPTSKLVNVSVRGQAGSGNDVLILGLVLQGTGQRTLLVRGIGPKLAAFGVAGTLVDPKLEVFDGSSPARRVLANEDWNTADYQSEMVLAANFVGAFALDQDSKDASTLALLEPGNYTIQVAGADGGTGETLVEVYEVP